jgi:nucleotide sugar dehydrogenase
MKKKISVIGVGKLGLCFSLNLEKKGYEIIGVDLNEDYVKKLTEKTFYSSEPYVNEYLAESKNLFFSTRLEDALVNDIIFIVVQTPSTIDHKYDHTRIDNIIENIKSFGVQKNRKDIIINCTTFPGYCENLSKEVEKYNLKISYNPEFIAQGSIIRDQVMADNVLIGQADEIAGNIIEEIYKDLCEKNPSINKMSVTEAEITKLSVNCFLTTKISFANMIGDIAERYNCNSHVILDAIGTDSRIGSKYLKPGFGFGGPCFPRDNKALSKCAQIVGVNAVISNATDEMNKLHLEYQIESFVKNNPDKSKPVEIEYVTYKKESTIIEESQQLKFAIELHKLGYNIKISDSREEVLNQIKSYFQ